MHPEVKRDHHRGRDPRRDALLPLHRRTSSQTRQPLLRIRTTREPVARQLPQRRNTGSGDDEEEVSASPGDNIGADTQSRSPP